MIYLSFIVYHFSLSFSISFNIFLDIYLKIWYNKNIKDNERSDIMFYIDDIELRKRFLKDNNIPIKIIISPYFEERLELFNKYYKVDKAIEEFHEIYSRIGNKEKYFELYNKLKDDIITYLNNSPEMIFFAQKEDMNKFSIKHKNLPKNSIYKPTNDGGVFISLDMKSANFTALKHYNSNIVKNKETYADFVKEFTDIDYFAKSKYIRQVVFGNINPARQITYEKYLMDLVITELEDIINLEQIVAFQNDEIVIDVSDYINNKEKLEEIIQTIKEKISLLDKKGIALKFELFKLKKIQNTDGYMKEMLPGSDTLETVFKGFSTLELPFVLRQHFNEELKDSDFIFLHEDKLAKLLEPIEVIL